MRAQVKVGQFREDLLYRLDVIHIHMPPLRERRDDIPLLARGLMERLSASLHRPPIQITHAAMERLTAYGWPGNVRELENVLTQALIRARDPVLTPDLLPLLDPNESDETVSKSRHEFWRNASGRLLSLDEMEAQHIQRALDETGSHKGRSCEILGISRPALERKIQKYNLRLSRHGIEAS